MTLLAVLCIPLTKLPTISWMVRARLIVWCITRRMACRGAGPAILSAIISLGSDLAYSCGTIVILTLIVMKVTVAARPVACIEHAGEKLVVM